MDSEITVVQVGCLPDPSFLRLWEFVAVTDAISHVVRADQVLDIF